VTAGRSRRGGALLLLLSAALAGCWSAGRAPDRDHSTRPEVEPAAAREPETGPAVVPAVERYPGGRLVEYRASCSVRSECRITYRDEEGELRSEIVVGDWSRELRVPRDHRLWVRAATGGCSTIGPSAAILVDGELRAKWIGSPDPAVLCQWITAVAEYDLATKGR